MAGGDKGRTMMVTVPRFHSLREKKWIPQKLYPSHSLSVQKRASQPKSHDSFGSMGSYRQLGKSSEKKKKKKV